jgi:hypothetical protein
VRQEVETELVGIWAQPTKEGALTQLAAFKAKYGKLYPEAVRSLAEEEEKTFTFYDFPKAMHRSIRTPNAIESLFSNVRQRTDQIDVFTTEMSCLTIVWATIEGIRLRKVPVEETGCWQRKGRLQEHVSPQPEGWLRRRESSFCASACSPWSRQRRGSISKLETYTLAQNERDEQAFHLACKADGERTVLESTGVRSFSTVCHVRFSSFSPGCFLSLSYLFPVSIC